MEAQPNKQRSFVREYWPLLVSCSILLISFLFMIFVQVALQNQGHKSHLLFHIYRKISPIVYVLFMSFIWLFAVFVLFGHRKMFQKVIIATILMLSTSLIGLILFSYSFTTHSDSVDQELSGEDLFYLTYTPGWLGDPGWYALDKCDSTGLSCETIFISESVYPEHKNTAILYIDDYSKNISVVIDGEVVFTHQT